MTFGHGGNIQAVARQMKCSPSEIIDMSSNINPLGPTPGLLDFLRANLETVTRLPEVDGRQTAEYFAAYLGVDSKRVLAGNGTTQFIYSAPRVLKSKKALIVGPTYADYADACAGNLTACTILLTRESEAFAPDADRLQNSVHQFDTVFICNPNNPTGGLIPYDKLHRLCRSCPQSTFIIDESYMPFVANAEQESMLDSGLDNVIVLLSISKIFGIPGLRIGFIIAAKPHIQKFRQALLPWSVNSLAHESVRYLTDHKGLIEGFTQKTRICMVNRRQQFYEAFETAPEFNLYRSQTPFVLIRLPAQLRAGYTWERLAGERVLVRNCANFEGLSDKFIRVSLKTPEANRLVAEKLIALCKNQENSCLNTTARRRGRS
ncbi:MAG: aminotransferase class I/II-fold pyridoxal phosphate-dependent enzyme [Desulfobacterales bacterium]|jgi:threonine-phosphate decarboxylase